MKIHRQDIWHKEKEMIKAIKTWMERLLFVCGLRTKPARCNKCSKVYETFPCPECGVDLVKKGTFSIIWRPTDCGYVWQLLDQQRRSVCRRCKHQLVEECICSCREGRIEFPREIPRQNRIFMDGFSKICRECGYVIGKGEKCRNCGAWSEEETD